jgi:hypothetical protein
MPHKCEIHEVTEIFTEWEINIIINGKQVESGIHGQLQVITWRGKSWEISARVPGNLETILTHT